MTLDDFDREDCVSLRRSNGDEPRTLLEQRIWQRNQSLDEFAEYANEFARKYREPGTLSERHLIRLVSGRKPNGEPIGRPRPALVRLLERIFGTSIDELLSPPKSTAQQAHPLRVAVAVVVRESDVLIVCRRATEGNAVSWQFPSGIVKPGAAIEAAAIRETLAETGIHCVVVRHIGSRLHPITNVICDYLLCDYVAGEPRNLDIEENVDVIWADKAKLTDVIPADHIYGPVLETLQSAQTVSR